MSSAIKSFLLTAFVLVFLGYFLLSHENKTSKHLGRTMAIGEARGMVTRCNAESDTVEAAQACAEEGFKAMLQKNPQ